MADLRDLITAIIRRHLGSPPDLNMFPHASDALADAIAGGLEPVMDELIEERDAARRAREVLPSLKDQLLDLVEVRPALAATLSGTYRRLVLALGEPPAEATPCVRIEPEVPGEDPTCSTHNGRWPCSEAGQPAAPLGQPPAEKEEDPNGP